MNPFLIYGVNLMKLISEFSQRVLESIEVVGLVFIAIVTLIAASSEISKMWQVQAVTLSDLLMLFLYLEVLSMVKHYISTGAMPVRYPLYIGIVALTRYLVLDFKELDSTQVLTITAATLLLSLAVLIIRIGHVKFPYPTGDDRRLGGKKDSYK
jgi:protein PsiE